MTRSVSVVVPALDDAELLEQGLPPLLAELERRALEDEVVLVDDTGRGVLAPWAAERFPAVRVVTQDANEGFARALLAGVRAARHELVLALNPDVRVRPGFLDPLVACLDEPDVAAVAPRVLLFGDPEAVESRAYLEERRGLLSVRQPALDELRRAGRRPGEGGGARAEAAPDAPPAAAAGLPEPVAFAVGGSMLFRRARFLERGGFDPLFEPFYWEDIDQGWSAWREGERVLLQPASVVEHHHRGTIGRVVPPATVRAAIERNRLLFHWKNLDEEHLVEHVAALHRAAIDAWVADRRDELVWLCLALERADEALAARRRLPPPRRGTDEILRASRPADPAG